jgi:hypothetical protein
VEASCWQLLDHPTRSAHLFIFEDEADHRSEYIGHWDFVSAVVCSQGCRNWNRVANTTKGGTDAERRGESQ